MKNVLPLHRKFIPDTTAVGRVEINSHKSNISFFVGPRMVKVQKRQANLGIS